MDTTHTGPAMDGAPLRRLPRELEVNELRVLGCLLEKERTTPDLYPLSVASLVSACNQKTSREPVLELSEGEVEAALDSLFHDVLVWRTDGARVRRWSHNLDRKLGLDPGARAVLTLLMLRGPQTVGELKGRSDRLHSFTSLTEVHDALDRLADPDDPLVVELPREPGRKESRWAHRLGGDAAVAEAAAAASARLVPGAAASGRGADLAARIDELEARVGALETRLSQVLAELGGGGD